MTKLPAIQEVTLSHDGNTVRLRPTLRAASHLERLHDGFPALFDRVAEFHIGTITEIILTAATSRQDAIAFLASFDQQPLFRLKLVVDAALHNLCAGFTPEPDADDKQAPAGKPMAWADFYRHLYRQATGALHWTPETAWNATPAEIVEAYAGLIDHLQAIHGAPDDKDKAKQPAAYTPERLKQIEEQGFDPAFDRAGLRALKRQIASGQ